MKFIHNGLKICRELWGKIVVFWKTFGTLCARFLISDFLSGLRFQVFSAKFVTRFSSDAPDPRPLSTVWKRPLGHRRCSAPETQPSKWKRPADFSGASFSNPRKGTKEWMNLEINCLGLNDMSCFDFAGTRLSWKRISVWPRPAWTIPPWKAAKSPPWSWKKGAMSSSCKYVVTFLEFG